MRLGGVCQKEDAVFGPWRRVLASEDVVASSLDGRENASAEFARLVECAASLVIPAAVYKGKNERVKP